MKNTSVGQRSPITLLGNFSQREVSHIMKYFKKLLGQINGLGIHYVESVIRHRGFAFLVTALDKLRSFLLSCLSQQPDYSIIKGYIRVNNGFPVFLGKLFRKVITKNGYPKRDISFKFLRRIYDVCSFLTKIKPSPKSKSCPNFSDQFTIEQDNYHVTEQLNKTHYGRDAVIQWLSGLCNSFYRTPSIFSNKYEVRQDSLGAHRLPIDSSVSSRGRFGPGTTSGSSSDLPSKLEEYRYLSEPFIFGFGTINHGIYNPDWFFGSDNYKPQLKLCLLKQLSLLLSWKAFARVLYRVRRDITPSRGIVVPKTLFKQRFIAAEPSFLGFLQQFAAADFDYRTKLFTSFFGPCISFTDQSINAQKALLGSRDRSLCTIDLSSASDRITTSLLQKILPSEIFYLYELARTDSMSLGDDIIYKFRYASMGSALTFKVLSLVSLFASAIGVALSRNIPIGHAIRLVSVYGDDIVAPSDTYDCIVHVLTLLGLRVNEAKSFRGDFLESCGTDAYLGRPITPLRLRFVPSNIRLKDQKLTSLDFNFPYDILPKYGLYRNARSKGYRLLARLLAKELYTQSMGSISQWSTPYHLSDGMFLSIPPITGVPSLRCVPVVVSEREDIIDHYMSFTNTGLPLLTRKYCYRLVIRQSLDSESMPVSAFYGGTYGYDKGFIPFSGYAYSKTPQKCSFLVADNGSIDGATQDNELSIKEDYLYA
jgi:hypothetical protein